jgi:hypothetical protein
MDTRTGLRVTRRNYPSLTDAIVAGDFAVDDDGPGDHRLVGS